MAADCVIGVDIGTQSTKAVLVSCGDGRILAQQSRAYQPDTPQALWAEQWPQVWLDAVEQCIASLVAQAPVPAASIRALCISSLYGGSGIPVDVAGTVLHP
ncbi:MAG: hypothetical protein EBR18_06515, partial [Betaproteobacteria bacterium]|nr:hypothetical protein [Betaproteobacteria bacterium]